MILQQDLAEDLAAILVRSSLRGPRMKIFQMPCVRGVPKVVRAFVVLKKLNVLRATTTCNFSSLIWPNGSAPATLASLLFERPEESRATNQGKTQ